MIQLHPPFEQAPGIGTKVDELFGPAANNWCNIKPVSTSTKKPCVETLLSTLTIAADQREYAEAWQNISNGSSDTLFTVEQGIDNLNQTILQFSGDGQTRSLFCL